MDTQLQGQHYVYVQKKRTVQANVEKFKYRWFWVLLNVVIQNLENRKK